MFAQNKHRFMAPAGEEGGAGGAVEVDRGDDFVPTEDAEVDPPAPVVAEKAPEKDAAKPPAGEKEGEKDGEKGKKGEYIPRERFNEAVGKERAKAEAASARAKELEGQLAVQKVSEDITEAQKTLKEMIKQRNSFLSDGELEKAGEVDSKIFALQDAIADRKAEQKADAAKEAAKEEMRYDAVVSKIETDHPELDPDSEKYDEDTVAEVRALMRGYQAEMRLSPSVALARAAKRVFGAGAKAAEPVVDTKTEETGVRRKQEATERNVDTATKQPASTKDVGLDHDKKGGGLDAKSIIKLPYAEFVKVGDEVLSKMRGDTL